MIQVGSEGACLYHIPPQRAWSCYCVRQLKHGQLPLKNLLWLEFRNVGSFYFWRFGLFPLLLFPALFSATCFQRAILSVYAVDI